MGSFLMHIAISERVRRKLDLSTKFIYGSILPDLIKMETGDRKGTHFLKTFVTDQGRQELPVVENAIVMLDGKMNKEVRLGYIAHLIQDLIWFDDYIPTLATPPHNGAVIYLRDNSVHTENDFTKDIYNDYTKINAYIIDKYCKEYGNLKKELATQMTEHEKILLDKTDKLLEVHKVNETIVITKDKLDSYIENTAEKVEKIVKELIGE